MPNYYQKLDKEFIYLAHLTEKKVKPLSRWETDFNAQNIDLLQNLGLKTRVVTRYLQNSRETKELIFSKNNKYIDIYENHFNNQPIKNNYKEKLLEGKLFGYPSCCIKNFIENGYKENGFEGRGQELLFYWACPGCKVTPQIIPLYREIYESLEKIEVRNRRNSNLFKKTAVSALIMITLGSGLHSQDAHLLPVKNDIDKNYLNYQEEILSGYLKLSNSDDYLAYKYFQLIDSLPGDSAQDSCFRIDHKMRGVIECPICGEMVNMGYVEICNPMRELTMNLDYMGLHFMEKGSFSYGDSANFQRVDLKKLKQLFNHQDDSHDSAQVAFDNDQDGLVDSVESLFGMRNNDKDSDDNQLLDGDQAAEQLIEQISELPLFFDPDSVPDDQVFLQLDLFYGLEECSICGKSVNMGSAIITNPIKDISYSMPLIALHYL
ncbi:MAG TPA: hypothetical protein VKP78_09270, partial [bacterium]|nr:hypothetical protein [bacterium]